MAINDSGTVTGSYTPPGFLRAHGFVWTEATGMVDIGIPGGGDNEKAQCIPTAINSAGNIVGYGRQVDNKQVAFFWSPTSGFTVLGDRWFATDGNVACAINDHDQVTGHLVVGPGPIYHAFLWSPNMNQPRDLGVVDGAQYSEGLGINNNGHIVGGSFSSSDSLWSPMEWTKRVGMRLLGVLPGSTYAEVTAINDAGLIIGYDITSTGSLSFYTAPGIGLKFLKDLGGGNSAHAVAFNQQGVIVGDATDFTGQLHRVMWSTPSSTPVDLATIDPALSSAFPRGINSLGQIVGEFNVQSFNDPN